MGVADRAAGRGCVALRGTAGGPGGADRQAPRAGPGCPEADSPDAGGPPARWEPPGTPGPATRAAGGGRPAPRTASELIWQAAQEATRLRARLGAAGSAPPELAEETSAPPDHASAP